MSNGGGIIIICGTGGTPVTDKTIDVYDAPLSVALKIDKDALIAQTEAAGRPHAQAVRLVNQLVGRIEHDYWQWGEELERMGVEYERHEPHAQP